MNELITVRDVNTDYSFPFKITREYTVNQKNKVIINGKIKTEYTAEKVITEMKVTNGQLYNLMRMFLFRNIRGKETYVLKSQRKIMNKGMMVISGIGKQKYDEFIHDIKSLIELNIIPVRFYNVRCYQMERRIRPFENQKQIYYELCLKNSAIAYLRQKFSSSNSSDLVRKSAKNVVATLESLSQPSEPVSFEEWVNEMTGKCMEFMGEKRNI